MGTHKDKTDTGRKNIWRKNKHGKETHMEQKYTQGVESYMENKNTYKKQEQIQRGNTLEMGTYTETGHI